MRLNNKTLSSSSPSTLYAVRCEKIFRRLAWRLEFPLPFPFHTRFVTSTALLTSCQRRPLGCMLWRSLVLGNDVCFWHARFVSHAYALCPSPVYIMYYCHLTYNKPAWSTQERPEIQIEEDHPTRLVIMPVSPPPQSLSPCPSDLYP